MRKFLFIVGMQIFHYLIWAFCMFDFNFFEGIGAGRSIYALFVLFVLGMSIGYSFDKGTLWLKDKPHIEKVTGMKKYIGELHEELQLYGEAMELQKKIKEFKNK